MEYRREIDGLRAVAVVPVILFHAGVGACGGGFVGVDVFFVISGYLITSLIAADLEAGRFSTVGFYERRARRILPALLLVMLACLPFAWFWLLPRDMQKFSQSLVAVPLFGSNILFWATSNYFDTASEMKPLLHTWSLAVEEQYYLLFPLLLRLAWGLGRRGVVALLAVALMLSLAGALWAAGRDPALDFYLLPTRGWELLIGALVSFRPARKQYETPAARANAVAEVGAVAGLAMIAHAVVAFDRQTAFPVPAALAPAVGTALVILCADSRTVAGRLLGSRVLVGIGLISYSAYLWHQPLLAFARYRLVADPDEASLWAIVATTFLLAGLSWKYVELPFRTRQRFGRRQIFFYAAAGSLFFIFFGLAGQITRGYPHRMPDSPDLVEVDMSRIDNGWCFYSVDSIDSLDVGEKGLGCWLGAKGAAKKGLLFGDSFAGQYEPFWDVVGRRAGVAIHAVTTNWCYPGGGDDFSHPAHRRALQQCRYNREYLLDSLRQGRYDFVVLGGEWGDVLSRGRMDNALDLIRLAAARSKLVVLMASPKRYDADVMLLYTRAFLYHATFNITSVPAQRDQVVAEANMVLEEQARQYRNVLFIDRSALFSVAGKPSELTRNGIPFSWDGAHISVHGSKEAAASFMQSEKWTEYLQLLGGNTTKP